MSGNPKLTPETEAKIKVLLHPIDPPKTEAQKLLLKQAKNCRELAHFLRTDPRVEGHFDMINWARCASGLNIGVCDLHMSTLEECGTTACAIGWANAMGLCKMTWGYSEFGTYDEDDWTHLFHQDHKRTSHEEAQVLEAHATKLEARV